MNNRLTINIKGELHTLNKAMVMGILNATPDSFYAGSRATNSSEIVLKADQIIAEGAQIIDIGGYSSRPGAEHISIETEKERLKPVLEYLATHYPDFPVSVDTFRAEVAHWAFENFRIAMINDISGGQLDAEIMDVAAQASIPYIAMHMRGTPQTMQQNTQYDNLIRELIIYFSGIIERASQVGINDIIIDPGFGFSKTPEQNDYLLHNMDELQLFEKPILAGISRKSMIYKRLGINPQDSLPGTIALHTIALSKGANIIRAHDVKEAVQMVEVVSNILNAQTHD
ncbi:MAG: dihydropteroate synthase [Salinivirgaceae bacterium]